MYWVDLHERHCPLFTIEDRFPKLDVAGSIAVSRSIFLTTYETTLHSEHRLNTVYCTSRLSNWFTITSRLSTGDCVYTFKFTSTVWPS
jgi:hypothetical protein